MLVRQDDFAATTFFREAEDLWRTRDVAGRDAAIHLRSIDIHLVLRDIYDGVDLSEGPEGED